MTGGSRSGLLGEHATLAFVERLLADERRPVVLVAHDTGTSVATELRARDLEGKLGFELTAALCSTAA